MVKLAAWYAFPYQASRLWVKEANSCAGDPISNFVPWGKPSLHTLHSTAWQNSHDKVEHCQQIWWEPPRSSEGSQKLLFNKIKLISGWVLIHGCLLLTTSVVIYINFSPFFRCFYFNWCEPHHTVISWEPISRSACTHKIHRTVFGHLPLTP